jgi:membrane fusion protein (multidrug efflux system)
MSFRKVLFVVLPLAGLAALGAYGYYANRAPAQLASEGGKGGPPAENTLRGGAASKGPPGGAAVAVEIAQVRTTRLQEDVVAVGTLRSNESVVVRPEISGRISEINFVEGAAVKKGQLLIALDSSVAAAEMQQAKANLALAEANHKRTSELQSEGFVSANAKDQSLNNLRVAQANFALAEARFAKTQIHAPFSGEIGIRQVSVGDYVKEGQDLVTLEDISSLKVDFRLPEVFLAELKRGQQVEMTSDAMPGKSYRATVEAIDPLIDQNGRAVVLRARLKNIDGQLRPGMFVHTRVILAERANALTVPEEALMPVGADQYVFKVVDGKAVRIKVKTGLRRAARVEIVDGLQAGDSVVSAGHMKVREGSSVRVEGAPATAEKGTKRGS